LRTESLSHLFRRQAIGEKGGKNRDEAGSAQQRSNICYYKQVKTSKPFNKEEKKRGDSGGKFAKQERRVFKKKGGDTKILETFVSLGERDTGGSRSNRGKNA